MADSSPLIQVFGVDGDVWSTRICNLASSALAGAQERNHVAEPYQTTRRWTYAL